MRGLRGYRSFWTDPGSLTGLWIDGQKFQASLAIHILLSRRLRAIGIRDRPITPRSPWQNGHVEPLIGSIRRECLDHVVVLGERHLRHLLANYAAYYNGVRTHLALDKDTPFHRPVQTVGRNASVTWLGGLHRYYVRTA